MTQQRSAVKAQTRFRGMVAIATARINSNQDGFEPREGAKVANMFR